jgi:heme o synthase
VRAEPLSIPLSEASGSTAVFSLRDLVALTKPRLSSLVLFTAAGGMWLAHRPLEWRTWLLTMLGTAGTVGAANALNCVFERDSDRFMARTADRPLAKRRMPVAVAVAFALVLAAFSLPTLYFVANPLTAALGLIALVSYAFVYTPLKSRSHWAMQVGAFPGALPPLMGWTAATGAIEAPGLALFAVLFVWQLPHFIAIALFRKNEYLAAGLTSLPLEKGDLVSRRHALGYVLALLPISFLPAVFGVAGTLYVVVASVLGAWLLLVTLQGWRTPVLAIWGRRLFGASLVYLTGLFLALGAPSI